MSAGLSSGVGGVRHWRFYFSEVKDVKWSEALSIASSIATLTGLSLKTMADSGGFKDAGVDEIAFKSVSAIFCALVSIGVLYGAVHFFSKQLTGMKPEYRPYMWTIGLALTFLFASVVIGTLYGVALFFWDVRY